MSKAYEIFDAAFSRPRDPRSDEYRHGVIDVLKHRLRESNEAFGKHQYKLGTAQADAYFAGCDEGHRLAREYLEKVGATLGNYRKLASAFFGEDSKAVKFLDDKIAESPNGENEEVIADEGQMVYLLGTMATSA